MVRNIMELIITSVYEQHENELDMKCTCEQCRNDVLALALNRTKPRYITNEAHGPYVRAAIESDTQELIHLLATVTQAASFVSDNPQCTRRPPKR